MSDEAKELTHAPAGAILRTDEPQDMLQIVMRAAQDPTIDPARLKEFLEIGRQLQADKAKQQWAMAFRAAKDELDGVRITKRGQIVYEGKNGKQDSVIKFLRYDDIAEAVKPILRKHQLTASYTYRNETTPPKTVCVLTLLHSAGHSETFESVPLPMIDSGGGKSDVQGAGSVMTYGRRYAIQGAFDIVAENQDDDGAMGRDQPQPITEQELETITNIVQVCDDKNPGFRNLFTRWMVKELKTENVKDLRQGAQLKSVMTKLSEKMKALGLNR